MKNGGKTWQKGFIGAVWVNYELLRLILLKLNAYGLRKVALDLVSSSLTSIKVSTPYRQIYFCKKVWLIHLSCDCTTLHVPWECPIQKTQ